MGTPKIAVVIHCFYVEQTRAIISFLQQISIEPELYVSAPAEKTVSTRHLFQRAFPDKRIHYEIASDRGFDIAPFVAAFPNVYPEYNLILKIHTKKSPHTPWLKDWGDYLLRNTAGSSEIVDSILQMFAEDETLGLVYPEIIPPLKRELEKDPWQENWAICQSLGGRLGLSLAREMPLDFPAGSMFWFRPKALAPLFELGLAPEDFPSGKSIQRNGTLAHAVERLLVLIAEKAGYSSRSVCFEPSTIVRDMSFLGKARNRVYCEWRRFMDFLGIH